MSKWPFLREGGDLHILSWETTRGRSQKWLKLQNIERRRTSRSEPSLEKCIAFWLEVNNTCYWLKQITWFVLGNSWCGLPTHASRYTGGSVKSLPPLSTIVPWCSGDLWVALKIAGSRTVVAWLEKFFFLGWASAIWLALYWRQRLCMIDVQTECTQLNMCQIELLQTSPWYLRKFSPFQMCFEV